MIKEALRHNQVECLFYHGGEFRKLVLLLPFLLVRFNHLGKSIIVTHTYYLLLIIMIIKKFYQLDKIPSGYL